MDDNNPAAVLGLSTETLEVTAAAYAGYGVALLREARAQNVNRRFDELEITSAIDLSTAASSLVIAASYNALIAPDEARLEFLAAAKCYHELGSVSGAIFDICGVGEPMWLIRLIDWSRVNLVTPDDAAAVLLCEALIGSRTRGNQSSAAVFALARQVRGARVGVSGIPLELIEQFCKGIVETGSSRGRPSEFVMESLVGVLKYYSTELETASGNKLHWAMLQTSFLPIPPEILAVGVITALVYSDDEVIRLRESIHDKRMLLPIAVARDLVAAPGIEESQKPVLRYLINVIRDEES
jgi:hypothetical protein